MTDAAEMTHEEREATLGGIGCARKRKEDIRFIQGKGNFTDDIKLPDMVFGDFVRSAYAHAMIKSINSEAALKIPGVLAVLTADDLRPLNLHWMPTLAGDTQAVLADEKVHFQNQEIAFVIGIDRYAVSDGVQAVEVDYEELPVLVDPKKALDADAPILRTDIEGKDDAGQGPRTHPNHIFNWQAGDKDATDRVFDSADITVKEEIYHPRVHPCPLETVGCVADMNPVSGQLTFYGTFQAPHVVRTIVSMIAGLPEHKIRVIAPDIGGGFGNKVGAYPGYVCSIVGSIVLKRPVKWVESRIDNLSTTAFARDYHMTGELAAT